MPNNSQVQLASIDTNLLADVQGGCGGRRRRCHGGCSKNVSIVNNYAAPAAAPAPSAGAAVDLKVGYQQA